MHVFYNDNRYSYRLDVPQTKKHTSLPPLSSISAPGVTINPTIIPMPSREPLITIPAPMLHILQPSNAKRNTAKARDKTNAQGPTTKRKKRFKSAFGFFFTREKMFVEQPETHYVYPPDTFVVLLTVRCWHTGQWTGTGESPKGTL